MNNLHRKAIYGGLAVLLPIGGLVAMQLSTGSALAKAVPVVPEVCNTLGGSVDFTDGGQTVGLTPGGTSQLNDLSIVGATTPDATNISGTSIGSCSGSVAPNGAPVIPPIVTPKASKAYVVASCASFQTATKDLKGLVITVPTASGNYALTVKSATEEEFNNPAGNLGGADTEVGFKLLGAATGPNGTDKAANILAYLDPTFSADIAACVASPGTYSGAISGATMDTGDSNASL